MKKQFVMDFIDLLADYDEEYFSNGSITKDYAYINNTIRNQGYWSGVRYNIYFTSDENGRLLLKKAKERSFGA